MSWAKSLRCGHSCEEYKCVRSETELGRESQEWPLVYEKKVKNMNYVRNKENVCFVCEMCDDNFGRITNLHIHVLLHCVYIYVECGLIMRHDCEDFDGCVMIFICTHLYVCVIIC